MDGRPVAVALFALALLAAAAQPAAAEATAKWKSVDYVVESFIDIALGSEHAERRRQTRKWTTPIRYTLVHNTGDAALHERLVATQFAHLAMLTGLSIEPAADPASANFRIVLSSESRLREDFQRHLGWDSAAEREKFFRETVCVANFASRRNGRITRAVAVIPVDRARSRGKLLSCFVEELAQVLGLPNDSDKVFPSVFNDRSIDDYLSGLDVVLLRILYDPRLTPGMEEAEVRPLVRRIAEEMARGGGFERAEHDAAGGLAAGNR